MGAMCRRLLSKLIFGLLFLCGFSLASAAESPSSFNVATAPAPDHSEAALHAAMATAFSQVLIKISGNSRIMTVPEIQQQLSAVEKFVQKYSYSDSGVQVTFDQRALLALLIQAQQPVWVTARPATVLWLSVNGLPPVASASQPADLVNVALQRNAAARAIPVILPAMDSDDQAVWQTKSPGAALDQPALEKIATHYQAPAILNGELSQKPDQSWTANWSLVWRGQVWQWRNDGSQEAVLQSGIDRLADLLGSQLAISLNQQVANSLWLAILGITNLTDYNTVLAAIKQLQPVLSVTVQDVGSHGVLLQVTTVNEGEDALKKALAGNPHFAAANAFTEAADVLNYQWKP
jgi:uncharacterized protein